MAKSLSDYERTQLEQLRQWQAAPPSWLTRRFAKSSGPIMRLAESLVPVSALQLALEGANRLAVRMVNVDAVLKFGDAKNLKELHRADLARGDALAERVRRRAVGWSAAGGAITGVAGAPGLALDVPALLTLALHTIHRTGLCYGYDSLGAEKQAYAIGVFSLASANSLEEKTAALKALLNFDNGDASAAVRDGLERAAQRELSKGAAIFSLHNLARQVGANLARRKVAAAVPVVGAVVGGAVNAWYLQDLAKTARYAFHARRFDERRLLKEKR